jgi:hypothetical protein
MMDFDHFKELKNVYSIAPAAIIGLFRYVKVLKTFRPFIFLMVIALITEITTHIVIYHYGRGNAAIINIYGLIECILWLWLFYNWNTFKKKSPALLLLILLLAGVWTTDNVILHKLNTFSSSFAIIYSFTLVFLSINQVNRQIVEERKNLFTDAKFLICAGILIFYTNRILVETFFLLDVAQTNPKFLSNIFDILEYVNVFVNLLFALATIWIPTRQRFSLPSS